MDEVRKRVSKEYNSRVSKAMEWSKNKGIVSEGSWFVLKGRNGNYKGPFRASSIARKGRHYRNWIVSYGDDHETVRHIDTISVSIT